MKTFVTFYGLNVKYIFIVKFRVMFKSEAMSVDIMSCIGCGA